MKLKEQTVEDYKGYRIWRETFHGSSLVICWATLGYRRCMHRGTYATVPTIEEVKADIDAGTVTPKPIGFIKGTPVSGRYNDQDFTGRLDEDLCMGTEYKGCVVARVRFDEKIRRHSGEAQFNCVPTRRLYFYLDRNHNPLPNQAGLELTFHPEESDA